MDIRGFGAIVTGNNLHTSAADSPLRLMITGGNTLVTGNCFENVIIDVDDKTDTHKPIVINNNLMERSRIHHKAGKLLTNRVIAGNEHGNGPTTAPAK